MLDLAWRWEGRGPACGTMNLDQYYRSMLARLHRYKAEALCASQSGMRPMRGLHFSVLLVISGSGAAKGGSAGGRAEEVERALRGMVG